MFHVSQQIDHKTYLPNPLKLEFNFAAQVAIKRNYMAFLAFKLAGKIFRYSFLGVPEENPEKLPRTDNVSLFLEIFWTKAVLVASVWIGQPRPGGSGPAYNPY